MFNAKLGFPTTMSDKDGTPTNVRYKAVVAIDGKEYSVNLYPGAFDSYKNTSGLASTVPGLQLYLDTRENGAVTGTVQPMAQLSVEILVALPSKSNDPTDEAFEKLATATLKNVSIVVKAENKGSFQQLIGLSWTEGTVSEGSLSNGQLGNDETFNLFPAYQAVQAY